MFRPDDRPGRVADRLRAHRGGSWPSASAAAPRVPRSIQFSIELLLGWLKIFEDRREERLDVGPHGGIPASGTALLDEVVNVLAVAPLEVAVAQQAGHVMPGFFGVVAGAEVAKVNLPVALLIWLMIVDAAQDRLLLTRTGP
jgi:hypothetical protein